MRIIMETIVRTLFERVAERVDIVGKRAWKICWFFTIFPVKSGYFMRNSFSEQNPGVWCKIVLLHEVRLIKRESN